MSMHTLPTPPPAATFRAPGARAALRAHAAEYAMEAALLGLFMVSACGFGVLLEHPTSPVHRAFPDPALRRLLMGSAMGFTAVVLIYSPWGKQSGAHMNPATTLAFLRLGRVARWDAFFYTLAQLAGATLGTLLMAGVLGSALADPHVRFVVTIPGQWGVGAAFAAEVLMTFVLMTVVLHVSASRHARWTGVCAGALVLVYIAFEAPVSGMSLNPARTFGSSVVADVWQAGWLYWVAPLLGMLGAAERFKRRPGGRAIPCAKLHHQNKFRCIFCRSRDAARSLRESQSAPLGQSASQSRI